MLWLCSSGCNGARSGAACYGYASSGCSETLRGRLSNAQRFGSDACVCCRVASFAPCTNDAVFRMTSGRPSSALVEAFCLKLGAGYRYHSTRRSSMFFYTSSRRTHERKSLVRGVGAASARLPGEQIGCRAWGKDLGCLCDLFQPPGTRTPRSWNCRCSARLPKAAHQSLPRPAALLDALDEALVETKTWSSKLPS